jgi:hypothetical protein
MNPCLLGQLVLAIRGASGPQSNWIPVEFRLRGGHKDSKKNENVSFYELEWFSSIKSSKPAIVSPADAEV